LSQIDQEKIDLILQYVLVVAGQESGWDRELGMIHLIKYTYLADLAYSKYHKGQTYTGLPWKFHHFGPWSTELYKRIEPALEEIGATKKIIESPINDRDFLRWSITNDQLFNDLGNRLDLTVMGTIQRDVRRFGKETALLLDYVYKTKPMVIAAPGELLDFSRPEKEEKEVEEKTTEVQKTPLTVRQRKIRKAKLQDLRERINKRIDQELMEVKGVASQPRYDEVYFQGVDWLDSLAGKPIEKEDLTVSVSDEMWKSKARFDDEIS